MTQAICIYHRQTLCHTSDYVPPFFEADCSVVVFIDLGEKCVQFGIGHRETSTSKGSLQLLLVKLAIVIVVDTRKKS